VGILASIWCIESLDRGLILVCRFSFVSSRECIPVAAQTRSCVCNACFIDDGRPSRPFTKGPTAKH
jgi:hypothetical protein